MAAGPQESLVGDVLAAPWSAGPTTWTSGGTVADWAPAYGSPHTLVARGGLSVRAALTRADVDSADPAVRAWRRRQLMLVEPGRHPRGTRAALWWRLAVHQRKFALCAAPCPDLDAAIAVLRLVVRAADRLTVALGHRSGEVAADWVVLDGETPLFVGMPDFPLVRVGTPRDSLAALLRTARLHRYVHDIPGPGPQRPPLVLSPRDSHLATHREASPQ